MATATHSIRKEPALQEMFLACQDRYPEDDELEIYVASFPDLAARAQAAKEVRDVEGPIIRKVIKRIFEVYPYEKHHDMAVIKSTRDVRLAVTYGVDCMLMGDPDYFASKLLYWMRRIIQAFEFPDILPGKPRIFTDPENLSKLQKLKPHQRSIFETYLLLKDEMEKALSAEAYAEMEPYLNQMIEILSHD